jgi:hypothetical protein
VGLSEPAQDPEPPARGGPRDPAIGFDASLSGEVDGRCDLYQTVWHRSRSTSIAARRRDRSALASREKCPCFQFARLLRSRPAGVRGPVLLPP